MQLSKNAGKLALASFFASMSALATASGSRPSANQVLLTRKDAQTNGLSNWLAVISAWFNNGYLLGLGLAFIVGFFFFIFAWIKLKKEKEKPDEQQEVVKYFWFMGIGVALMGVTAIILAVSDTIGIGSNVGKGVGSSDALDQHKSGYGIGNKGAADSFNQ